MYPRTGRPIVVDLDGTLVRTDTLLESFLGLIHKRPLGAFSALLTLRQGRAAFKERIADLAEVDSYLLPLNTELVSWLRQEKASGRHLVLATASDQRTAQAVAQQLDLFDTVLASDGKRNLKGAAKAAALVVRFGQGGFDYVGDSRADLPVWAAAHQAVIVGGKALANQAARVAEVSQRFAPPKRRKALVRALRPHQWLKNLLVFLPVVAAHQLGETAGLLAATLAFIAFSLTASSVYVLNDLLDLAADRAHPRKCRRPFASGTLPLAWGLLLSPLLLLTAIGLSLLFLPWLFTLVLVGYFLLTTAYSFGLKRKPVLDVILLAALYTVRIIAGAAAVALVPSFWLLAFSMFIFLSLALAKRYTELDGLRERGKLTAAGRGWHVDDLPLVQTLGTGAGLVSALVMALYINSPQAQQLYAASEILWLVCPLLLYWIVRLWFKTHRAEMHDDPVVFALRDRVSLAIGALTAVVVLVAAAGIPL
jgi:4-hydroxybenzoate polyprenyltransferase/phosphoserine phosphatase